MLGFFSLLSEEFLLKWIDVNWDPCGGEPGWGRGEGQRRPKMPGLLPDLGPADSLLNVTALYGGCEARQSGPSGWLEDLAKLKPVVEGYKAPQ